VADGLTTDVVRSLDAAGVRVTDVTTRRASLDDVFFTLTGHAAQTAKAAPDAAAERSAA
jgi:ABC-2 type transport system ATP-binding protein